MAEAQTPQQSGARRGDGRTVVLSGASGLVGTALQSRLRSLGWTVHTLVRRAPVIPTEFRWDPQRRDLDPSVVDGVDALINLSGASIGTVPWTQARKTELIASRRDTTLTLVDALRRAASPPPVFASASGHAWYGNRGSEALTEAAAGPGTGFLAGLAARWELDAAEAAAVTRVVHLRSGDVFGPGSGILHVLAGLTRWGLGNRPGDGKQFWPWISLVDEVSAIVHLLDAPLQGAVNLAGPTPATADEVTRRLAEALHRPRWLPAPKWGLRLALGEAADEMLLASRQLVPERLLTSSFEFQHATVHAAIDWALRAAD